MWFEIWKGRQKDSNPGRSRQKEYDTRFNICATGADDHLPSFEMLTIPIIRWWAELV